MLRTRRQLRGSNSWSSWDSAGHRVVGFSPAMVSVFAPVSPIHNSMRAEPQALALIFPASSTVNIPPHGARGFVPISLHTLGLALLGHRAPSKAQSLPRRQRARAGSFS